MSVALQVAFFLASVAIVTFVLFTIPLFIVLGKYIARAARELEELKSDVRLLIQESRNAVQNVNNLAMRVQQQMDEVDKMVRMARAWGERANRVAEEVGEAVESPIFILNRMVSIVRKGLGSLSDILAGKQ